VTLTVADYRGRRQTLLPVREIILRACALIILKPCIQPTWGLNPGQTDNSSVLAPTVPVSHRDKPGIRREYNASAIGPRLCILYIVAVTIT